VPADVAESGLTDFCRPMPAFESVVTSACDGSDTMSVDVPNAVAVATAVFVTWPVFTSACVSG